MLKALIIEDEFYVRKGLIEEINRLKKNVIIVGECDSVSESIILIKSCKPDIIFLDIELSDGNAFDILEQTKNLDFKIIFITGYDEYALKALKMQAVDYILKPVDSEELALAIDKAVSTSPSISRQQVEKVKEDFLKKRERLVLRLNDGIQIITLNELMFCKSDKGYTTFHLSKGKPHIASKPIKEFEEQLLEADFIRSHQSYIVNLAYVSKYDKKGYIILKNEIRIPVSIRKKEKILSHLLNIS